jgi:hypothetical protein
MVAAATTPAMRYAAQRSSLPRSAPWARCQLAGSRPVAACTATAGTAEPAPAPAARTQGGGVPRNSAASARMTIKPGTMNAVPPTTAPRRPRTRQAQKIDSWVDAGPGSRLHAAIASSNSTAAIHRLRSTQSSRSSLMWVGGPPKPMQPIRPHSRSTVAKLGRDRSSRSPVWSASVMARLRGRWVRSGCWTGLPAGIVDSLRR